MSNNYVCYHLHTMLSLLDSATSFEDYVDRAKELGMTSIGFSEHGNIFQWYKKKAYAESNGLKYLHGIECYLTETLDEKIRDNYHTILIAKNLKGMIELNNLFYISTRKDHTYYKPRLSFDEFLNISDNIIKISACIQSPLNKYRLKIQNNATSEQKNMLIKLLKHYDYYEIQYHNEDWQIKYNQYLYKMSKKFNKPLIAGTDTHNLNPYKAECRVMLQYGKTDGAWGDEENNCDLTFKSYDELVEMFKVQNSLPMNVILEAINNTNIMADSVETITFNTDSKYPLLYGDKDEKVLWERLEKKYKEKIARGEIDDSDGRYKTAIKEEMAVFKKINMIGFMLFMSEISTWAKDNGIAMGFARGSVSGSTVAYISDITDVDPIKWNTVFSRFANENRVEEGDIDCDFYEEDRPKIYNYIIDRFGKENTSYILALGTLADKAVIDVIGKAFRIKAQKENTTTIYTLDKISQIKKEWDENKEATKSIYSDLFYYYDGLVGCTISQSQHPAGILVSPVNLIDMVGAFYGNDNQSIVPIDMEECHELGLVKFDILGLKSVGVIDKTYKLIGKKFPKAYQIDWNDPKVFEDISNDSTGIFQFESSFAKDSIKQMQPKSVEDLSLCSACLRPSGESYRTQVFNHEIHKNPSSLIDEVLKDSNGFLCIEENQLMPTTTGLKKIKDIHIGDMVYTHDGVNKVNNVYNNGKKDVYNVHTSINDICCTDNHKILTQYGWVELKDIMINPNKYCIAVKVNDCNNENDYDKNLLRILGWLIGDGILHQNGKQKSKVQFVNTDLDVINDFCTSVNNVYSDTLTVNIHQRKTKVNKLPIYYASVNWRYPYVMRFQKVIKPIITFLDNCNIFNRLAQDKEVPPFVFNLNKESILTFLGAYTDTDCCVKQNVLTYHCSSYNLLLGIQELFRKIGFLSCLNKNDKTNFTLSITKANDALRLLKDYSVVVRKKNIDFNNTTTRHDKSTLLPIDYVLNEIITTKQKVFHLKNEKIILINHKYVSLSMLKTIKQDNKYKDIIKFNEYTSNDNIKWTQIKSIDKIGERTVYDLEIDNIHDFVLCGGLIVHNCYQEQTIAFLQKICGLSGSEADTMRRNIAKKMKEKVDKMLPVVIDGYCNKSDKPRKEAENEVKDFIQVIQDASGYQFGFNHSLSYSMLSYVMGWLRYYYPTEFCTSFLNCAKNDEDLINGTLIARNKGCHIVNPKFRYSSSEYKSVDNSIYKGIGSIKNIGQKVGNALYTLKDNHYNNFIELLKDIENLKEDNKRIVNSKALNILIHINFFEEFGSVNELLYLLELYNKYGSAKVFNKEKLAKENVLDIASNFASNATEKQLRGIDNLGFINALYDAHKDDIQEVDELDHIKYEVAYLGYTNKTYDCPIKYYVVLKAEEDKYNRGLLSIRRLCDGKQGTFKVDYKWWEEYQCEQGDIVMVAFRKKPKKKLQDGHWVNSGEEEYIIRYFAKVDKI